MLRTSPPAARADLLHRLNLYRDWCGHPVVLVFDGTGPETRTEMEPGSVQVIYSAAGQSADAVLEQLARSYADRFDIQVATDDRAVQDAVIGAGGGALSSAQLQEELDRSGARFRSRWNL